jgi:hypothetical protein
MVDLNLIESVAVQRCNEIVEKGSDITADYKVEENRAVITIRKKGSIDGYEYIESIESMTPHGIRYSAYIEHLKNKMHVGIIVPNEYLRVMKIEALKIHQDAELRPTIMSYMPDGELRRS